MRIVKKMEKTKTKKTDRPSDSFLHASEEERLKILTRAADESNREQRKVFLKRR